MTLTIVIVRMTLRVAQQASGNSVEAENIHEFQSSGEGLSTENSPSLTTNILHGAGMDQDNMADTHICHSAPASPFG